MELLAWRGTDGAAIEWFIATNYGGEGASKAADDGIAALIKTDAETKP